MVRKRARPRAESMRQLILSFKEEEEAEEDLACVIRCI